MTEQRPPAYPLAPNAGIVAVPRPLVIKQVPAHHTNYTAAPYDRRPPDLLVLHCTEGCEGGSNTDANVAAMFARPFPPGQKKRSAHYVVDADSCTQCVEDLRTAWHCGHTGNAMGIGIELCGKAAQSRAEWLDASSIATLNIAARLCADLCDKFQIPPVVVNARDLLCGKSGITTHAFIGEAWRETNHYDPGPGFPLGAFVVAVRSALAP